MTVKSENAMEVAKQFVENYPFMFTEEKGTEYWIHTIARLLRDYKHFKEEKTIVLGFAPGYESDIR